MVPQEAYSAESVEAYNESRATLQLNPHARRTMISQQWREVGGHSGSGGQTRTMAASPYTLNRTDQEVTSRTRVFLSNRVTLFDFPTNWTDPEAVCTLDQARWVVIDVKKTQEAFRHGLKFVYVRTQGGRGEQQGYIPKSALNDYIFASGEHDLKGPLTGVSYGGDKWVMDASGRPVPFPRGPGGSARCVRCGNKANGHKIYESEALAKICADFVFQLPDLLAGIYRGKMQKPGIMVGVLQGRSGDYYFAISGTAADEPAELDGFVRSFVSGRHLGAFHVCRVRAANQFYIEAGQHVPFAQILALAPGRAHAMSDLACAAPKLIQECYAQGDEPEFLSEKWLGRHHEYKEGDTIKSCDTCRTFLPFMFCSRAE